MTGAFQPPLRAFVLFAALGLPAGAAAQQPPVYAEGPLLQIITQMPEGSWARVNANSYSDVWTPSFLRPLYGTSNPTPAKIFVWSSFAWDSNRGDLILYGGGHANYSGNDVYRWRARDLSWQRAALPSEIRPIGSAHYLAIDGPDGAPSSAHTYDNAEFLPRFDRYVNFGGAIFNSGQRYLRPSESDPSVFRTTGPYLFDPSRADPDKVGGTTGSHVQRVAPHPEVSGGNMWQNRDAFRHLAGQTLPGSHVNGCTAYSDEPSEHDIVYVAARYNGSSSPHLFRYQFTNVADPRLDVVTKVGTYWAGSTSQTTCAYDPVHKVLLRTGAGATRPFHFWDLSTAGPNNRDKSVDVTGDVALFTNWLNQTGKNLQVCAIDYDRVRGGFALWCGDGVVWTIQPPTPLTTSGWRMTRQPAPAGEVPPNNVGSGILGKWKYLRGFDVFMGLENSNEGNVWVYKPMGWVDPQSGNLPPTASLTAPAQGSVFTVGQAVALRATASDPDGAVAQVEFRVDGATVAATNLSPYAASWTPPGVGTFSIDVQATDNLGRSTVSAAVSIMVEDAPPPAGGGTTTLQREAGGYAGVADTYLSSYHPGTMFGGSQIMRFYGSSYTPMVRFAVFNFEGGPVPNGAVIESAKLNIYKGAYDHVFGLHALRRAWSESEANWGQAMAGQSWAVPGAKGAGVDYEAEADAVTKAPWNSGWVEFDVTARIRAVQQGAANHGWRLVSVSGTVASMTLYASEQLTLPERRPRLLITWR